MSSLSSIDRKQAFRYMGLQKEPDEKLEQQFSVCEKKLLSAVCPRYCWKLFPKYQLADLLLGKDIQNHLQDCYSVILFCATLSQGTDTCIRMEQANDILNGVMTDAMASAFMEQFCDEAEQEILSNFENLFSTWRFSPGYGDFPLSVQHEFLQYINAEKRLGVCVTENDLLIPRKTVTAVIGLSEKPLPTMKKGCAICRLHDSCSYRLKGVHCH